MGELLLFLILLAVGYVFGSAEEKRHYNDLLKRERKLRIRMRGDALGAENFARSTLVTGSVVIGSDYFRLTLASFLNLFGGRLASQARLLDRARREAVLRMVERAQAMGAVEVVNIHLSTAKLRAGCAEVMAYGTAVMRT